jgi:hypothetical protein
MFIIHLEFISSFIHLEFISSFLMFLMFLMDTKGKIESEMMILGTNLG